ncbi:MAG: DUF4301 family protein, partial [Bacteroidaceae bacterium]|nr:DUF4301 family protein [Bacteroidaceae bacterium]
MTAQDKALLEAKGISEAQIEQQLRDFQTGFPFLKLAGAAAIGRGIMAVSDEQEKACIKAWDDYKAEGHHITKFVPASGAASRMFKDMFEFLSADYDVPTKPAEKQFFEGVHDFAFFQALDDSCQVNEGRGVDALIDEGQYKAVVANMLDAEGLNYGQLPKGLLQFHAYDEEVRTPLEEHLVEAALYAASKGEADVHFTVSTEHRTLFEALVERVLPEYEKRFGITYHISFSEQKPSTDTVAANMDNTPFRNEDGTLLFRPGGHGALIQNLSDLQSDVVFVKNIDNVVPDKLKPVTVTWKQVIAGVLVKAQQQAFAYLRLLDTGKYSHEQIEEMIRFVRHELCTDMPGLKDLEDAELVCYLRKKLNRPMRVCGVVKNVGEPGGGPFLAYNPDGSVSLQILESSQIDKNNPEYMKMFTEGTHFNPVDLVCGIRDYKGEKFDLPKFVDPQTGFISYKSKNGKELKALELPGLWNGAMSDWSTIFVEVPLETFNPVKTVCDLLRPEHQ